MERREKLSSQQCLSQAKIIKDMRLKHCAASSTSEPRLASFTVLSPWSSPFYIPSKLHVSSVRLPSALSFVSAHITLPISPSPRKQQEVISTPPEVSWCASLWSPDKWSSTTQCKADQYMCVVSKESFITCPFTCLL